jgi:PAS domain S-box-containing protein
MDLQERLTASLTDDGRYRLLVDAITDYAIYMLDADGRVASWNPGAQRFKGYQPQEIIGEHFSRFYTDEDRASDLPGRALREAVAKGRFENEGWRVRKDGSRFWAHVVIDPIRTETGEVLGFAKITRDLTERKIAEDALKETQQALEQAREALFQSQKLDAIGQLTGGIAHDFNNLLMVVLASLELVRKRLPHDPKITPLIENAVQGAERGAALTQRMLAFARKQELSMAAVDLPVLVRGMTGLLQRSLGPSVQIETRFPLGLPPLYTDPAQLEAVLLNLTVNARDAMPDGGTISIEAKSETIAPGSERALPPGAYVRLSVADTGQGMSEETLTRATEPFFTTKGVGKGTGLGLSMVHGLAQQSGGHLGIRSRLGEGTVVDLWLPQAKVDDELHVFAGTAEPETLDSGAALVVLAVDDDALVLINTVAMLEELGHRVFPAASAQDALATLRREPVDLVITDHAMPLMTGLQLAEAIRADQPSLPVILATGYAELPPNTQPMLPRLSKPFLQRDLATAIRQVVGEGATAAE